MNRRLHRGMRTAIVFVAVTLACVPVSFALTFLMMPLWRWVEANLHVESVGHSGPADWCFWTVYGLTLIIGVALLRRTLWPPRPADGS